MKLYILKEHRLPFRCKGTLAWTPNVWNIGIAYEPMFRAIAIRFFPTLTYQIFLRPRCYLNNDLHQED